MSEQCINSENLEINAFITMRTFKTHKKNKFLRKLQKTNTLLLQNLKLAGITKNHIG